ncbi:hypothetical protein D2Q93_07225 [Alicyclobacillaceae bacterium I2511]|nr:hypothetical protein D2Q93_07225 [Alicyclobacillaceae bacterium I2511]
MAFEEGVIIAPTGDDDKVALWLYIASEQSCVLEYYDNKDEGILAAKHFVECSNMAYEAGFEVISGFFIHPDGHRSVPIVDALDLRISPQRFRRLLNRRTASQVGPRG